MQIVLNENERLCTENRHQKKEESTKSSYVARGGILTGLRLNLESRAGVVANILGERQQRVSPKCSICQSLEHNARACPEHPRTV